ncbi:MAG TPA: DEAD/DEAH box helicase [Symbiobacteriaceae bacterium]|jgi:ATP-dependent Lhr-like helicase
MPLSSFHPVVRAWFEEAYGTPSPPQALGWPAIARGENALVLAPTGSGKTLAAFLKCLDTLYQEGDRPHDGVQVLYISPLKALNNDIHRNLEVPLRGIEAKARAMGAALPRLTTAVRTGDTPAKDRAAMLKRPPHVLITTPESLYLMLTSQARRILRTVRYVIVDEIHAVSGTKRGVHLSLSLERLEALLSRSPVRIGLSATQRPLEEIARFLGGVGRPVTIIDTGTRKHLDLLVEVPIDDMRALPENTMWSAIQPRLLELVASHRSTLVFVNYRGLAERLAGRLNALAGREVAKVHHGSMSRQAREQVEADLKEGRLPCLVATSSLELGIDVGAVDLVVQVESPKSASRGLQRVGRAGHILGMASKGRLLPKFRGDLVETACIVREMLRGEVEETRVPTGALDVLAQQVIAMAAMDEWPVDDLLALLRRSYCYRDLTERQLTAVLEMLSGRYPSEEFREMRPRIVWEKERNIIRGRENARMLAVLSGGTIPDRGYYGVYIAGTNVKLGEVDEEFVYESRDGDVFVLGTNTWRIQAIEHDRITVADAFGQVPRVPFWKGDGLGRDYAMGLKVGAFVREVAGQLDRPEAGEWLQAECALDGRAAANLLAYLREERDAAGVLPTDQNVVVEYFWDEIGDRRVVILSPFGGRVHLAWMMVLKRRIRELLGLEAEMLQTDDGILIRLPGTDAVPPVEQMLRVAPEDASSMLLEEVGDSPVFGAYFRMNAGRSLVLPRPRPGRRQPFWLQRLKAADLLQVARKYESFPVVLETYREVLRDVLDMDGLLAVLSGLQSGAIALTALETSVPSPMAASVMMGFIGTYMYEGDTPKAERRGALLNLNRELLKEILGAEQLRHLLDERAVAEVDARLQHLPEEWRPRNPDETEDLLRRLGDLSPAELGLRGVDSDWLAQLASERRAAQVPVNGELRWIAADDRAMYADLATYAGAVIRRFARNRGPFQIQAVVQRYGFAAETVERYLAVLQAEGILSAGEFTPSVTGREYCDTDVLQQIHRLTLSLLRREVEPVDGPTFARFLLAWQGVGRRQAVSPASGQAAGMHALRRVLSRLQGAPLPAEAWERDVLPARVPGYQPLWLDQLCAAGELHWSALPGGKAAFYLPAQVGTFAARFAGAPEAAPLPPEQTRVLEALAASGADFLGGVARAAGLSPAAALEALWALCWAGLVTNDTFAPLRQALRATRASARRERPVPLVGGTGRWSCTARLAAAAGEAGAAAGERPAEAYAGLLLERYGVVTREAAQAEDGPVGWPEVLAVLKEWELRGKIRRGYFIRDLSGVQFALPEAVERLRAARDSDDGSVQLVAACDPANPYGAILPPPAGGRVARLASTYLALADGRPVLAVEAQGRRLTPLEPLAGDGLRQALACVKELLAGPTVSRTLRRVEVEFWGETPIYESAAAPVLQELGFERAPTKLVLYR